MIYSYSLDCKLKLVEDFQEVTVRNVIESGLNSSVILSAIDAGRKK